MGAARKALAWSRFTLAILLARLTAPMLVQHRSLHKTPLIGCLGLSHHGRMKTRTENDRDMGARNAEPAFSYKPGTDWRKQSSLR